MNEGQPLAMILPQPILDAIIADPDADGPRLACADWLAAEGHVERAEYLLLALRQETHFPNSPARSAESRRMNELHYRHRKTWEAEKPAIKGVTWSMRRGLFEEAAFNSVAVFEKHATEVFRGIVRVLRFDSLRSHRLFTLPELAPVRHLRLGTCSLDGAAILALAACPYLSQLQRLELPAVAMHDERLLALAEAPWMPGLRSLSILGSYQVRGVVERRRLADFARSPRVAGLERLDLSAVGLGEAGMAALLDGAAWQGLRMLDVCANGIGPEGLAPLLAGPCLPQLVRLKLDRNRIGPEGVRRLAALPSLRWLVLGNNLIGNAGAEALAEAGAFAALTYLDVSGNAIGDPGAHALANAGNLAGLESLEVGGNLIGDDGMHSFGETLALTGLRVFSGTNNAARADLSSVVAARFRDGGPPIPRREAPPVTVPTQGRMGARVGDADEDGLLEAIVSNPEDDLPRLVYADWLEEQGEADRAELLRIGTEPAAADARAAYNALVKRVTPEVPEEFKKSIHRMTFSMGLLSALVQMRGLLTKAFQERGGPWMRRVRTFKLRITGTTKHWEKVAAMPLMGHLRNLDLSHCSLGRDGLAALVQSPHFKGLYALGLSSNRLTRADSMGVLVEADTLPRLVSLDLSGNWMNQEAVRELLRWPQMRRLTALSLAGNWIQSGGVALVAESSAAAELLHLNISNNYLNDSAVQAVVQASGLLRLTHLGLAGNNLTDAAAHALANWPGLARLRRLDLQRNQISLDGLLAVARSPHLGPEVKVSLSRYQFQPLAQQQLQEGFGRRLVWGW